MQEKIRSFIDFIRSRLRGVVTGSLTSCPPRNCIPTRRFSARVPEFTCQVAGCRQVFDALEDYEHHYHTLHGNVCSSCRRAFPSGHLLDTHILEWHDSLFQILAERQDMVSDACPPRPRAVLTGLVPEPRASWCQRLGSRLGEAVVPGSGW